MVTLQKIDEAANLWNKTKDSKYKEEWYKLIKEWCNGPYNTERRVVPISSSIKRDNGKHKISRSSWTNLL